jgi:CDP-glycerol glycerophosphotransferase (TagB/SpsB family)
VDKDDRSDWFNTKSIRNFVTSTQREYDSICGDGTAYKFTKREVALTGLPRHDRLVRQGANKPGRNILIMPTWRSSLTSNYFNPDGHLAKNPEFIHSDFYKTWLKLLKESDLNLVAKKYNYNIIFFLHAGLKPYIEDFRAEQVAAMGHDDVESIQDLFLNASVLITDFSSVAFEMAYLERPVLYYQFDEDFVYGGGHHCRKGYFDYRRDGMGPVCTNQSKLLETLESTLYNHAQVTEPYSERMRNFFAFRDGRCCERVMNLLLDF